MGHPQAVGGGWILALLLLPETSSIPGTSSQPTGTRVSLSHPYTVQPSPQVQQAAQDAVPVPFLFLLPPPPCRWCPSQHRCEAALTWWFLAPPLGARACACTPASSPALKQVLPFRPHPSSAPAVPVAP